MRPIPIPEETRKRAEELGWRCKVISGPDGDLTGDIRPVDSLVGVIMDETYGPTIHYNVIIQIEEEDRPLLDEHGRFWLCFAGAIVPFSLEPWDPKEDYPKS